MWQPFLSRARQQALWSLSALPGLYKVAVIQSLGWEDVLEEAMATHSSLLAWRIHPMERGAWRATVHRITKSRIRLNN